MTQPKTKSIIRQVNTSSRWLMVILVIPVLLSILIMLLFATQYQHSVSRMETIASLKPMVDYEISEELWSAISGRKSFAECGVDDTISHINRTLDTLIGETQSQSQLELVVARRTMDTLLTYVRQIETNMNTGVPVIRSEETLEEVRNVAILADSMLEDVITQEIDHTAKILSNLRTVVFLSAALDVLIVVAAFLITRSMLRRTQRNIREPIEHLEHFAGLLADSHLRNRIPHTDVEELGTLTDRVNIMANNLEELIEQNRREQENLAKAELRLLQAQINPHFLYNTLDAIIWQAEAGHSDEVIALTRSLSDFFRISLSSGEDWIPVRQEMNHLAGYLSIQKTRYRDILTYEIDVDEDIGEIYILKLLLQPLVENALYHGIKFKRGGGRITVTGRREDDWLCFRVHDTGRGMTPERLADVKTRMKGRKPILSASEAGGGSGFGLSNVDQRIRLYYNLEKGLDIQSDLSGTTVSFRVPVRKEAGADD